VSSVQQRDVDDVSFDSLQQPGLYSHDGDYHSNK